MGQHSHIAIRGDWAFGEKEAGQEGYRGQLTLAGIFHRFFAIRFGKNAGLVSHVGAGAGRDRHFTGGDIFGQFALPCSWCMSLIMAGVHYLVVKEDIGF